MKTLKTLKILDFDIESRPLSFLGSDFTTDEVTAIAACFVGTQKMNIWLLGKDDPIDMLNGFVELYDQADIVTGHFIRNFDLPMIQGSLMEYGLPSLKPKLTICTKNDLKKRKGISASQENLSQMLSLALDKTHMSQIDWRLANRLTPEGIRRAEKRVSTDVYQHMLLRAKLVELGLLGAPKMWRP